MALTVEQRLSQEVGALVTRIYQLEVALEMAHERIKELEPKDDSK